MTVRRIYLDDAGGAPVLLQVGSALKELPEGNPSSPHAEGRAARAALDRARDRAAAALGAQASELVFLSSGTEAVNLALLGAGRRLPASARVVTWAAEHQSVLAAARQLEAEGRAVTILPVDAGARADPDGIPADAGLISIGLANNEVGSLQPVAEVAARAREQGALLHLDACQGPRWMEVPPADLTSFSGHKLGAGRGGLLRVRGGLRLQPLQFGGPQEWGRRAGREDVAAATAVAVALEVIARERGPRAAAARPLAEKLGYTCNKAGWRLTGRDPRLPNYASAACGHARGEDVLLALDLAGVAASSGSACASGSLDPSHVLLAMGLSLEEALGSLRLTVGYDTTDDDVESAAEVIEGVLDRLHAHA